MALSAEALRELTIKVVDKIKKELTVQNGLGCLNEYLANIHCSELIANYNTAIIPRDAKIAVFGDTRVDTKFLNAIAKDLGINPTKIEYHLDYDKNKRFDFSKFKNSSVYSDIIFGPSAHKAVGIGDNSSPIAMMENDNEHYPKIIRAEATDSLKITKTSFRKALSNTQYLLMFS